MSKVIMMQCISKIKQLKYELSFKNKEIKRLHEAYNASAIAELRIDNELLKKELIRLKKFVRENNDQQDEEEEFEVEIDESNMFR